MSREAQFPLTTKLLFGAIAGFVATAAMTAAMTRLHRRLPEDERYPLPPREITGQMLDAGEETVRDAAMAAHFLYGAGCGALLAALRPEPGPGEGAAAGVAIWTGSYFGWVPGFGILRPASDHPPRRNALMLAVHLVWGAATAVTLNELFRARRTILNGRRAQDADPAG
jgi:hypothetical protein